MRIQTQARELTPGCSSTHYTMEKNDKFDDLDMQIKLEDNHKVNSVLGGTLSHKSVFDSNGTTVPH